jgi:hypothetical protein
LIWCEKRCAYLCCAQQKTPPTLGGVLLIRIMKLTPELIGGLQDRIEYIGQGVTINLANGLYGYSGKLRHKLNVGSARQIPRNACVA